MRSKFVYIRIVFFIISFLGFSNLFAQQAFNSCGSQASSALGYVSYSIGQVFYNSLESSSGKIIQGVQQPYDISLVGRHEEPISDMYLSVFPNPTDNQLVLTARQLNNRVLSYRFCDAQGKQFLCGNIRSSETYINITEIASATYFIYITDEYNNNIRIFKVVKK